MTLLAATIPLERLLSILAGVVILATVLFELVAYYRFPDWYYRIGPATRREQWQTAASEKEIRQAIRPLLDTKQLRGRETDQGFIFLQRSRPKWAWKRIAMAIGETERGAALHYEARPPLNLVPMIFPIVWLATAAFGFGPVSVLFATGLVAIPIIQYGLTRGRIMSRYHRLHAVLKALAPFGLRVCDQCGYDLFGHAATDLCPECGNKGPSP